MHPGFYVVRMPFNGAGSRLIIESVCFKQPEDTARFPEGYARDRAQDWCDFIQSQHPKDDVFVIERPAKEEADV